MSAMNDVEAFVRCAFDAFEDHRRWIGTFFAAHQRRADAIGPDLQLLGGRGAEGVARDEQDLFPVGDQLRGELADGRGLAAAVDADDQQHERLGAVERQRRRIEREDLSAALAQESPDRVGVFQVLARERGADLLEQALAGAHADVGGQQDLFDLVDDARIELLAAGEDLTEARDPPRPGARQAWRQRGGVCLPSLAFLLRRRVLLAARLLDRRGRRREGDDLGRGARLGGRFSSGRAGRSAGVAAGAGRAARDVAAWAPCAGARVADLAGASGSDRGAAAGGAIGSASPASSSSSSGSAASAASTSRRGASPDSSI